MTLPVTDGVTHVTFMHHDANGLMDYTILPLGNVPNAPATVHEGMAGFLKKWCASVATFYGETKGTTKTLKA